MNINKLLFVFSICISPAITGVAQTPKVTAREILDRHIIAIGGNNWKKINNIRLSGTMKQMGMEMEIVQTTIENKGSRTDISMGNQKGFIILTPAKGWMYIPFGGMQVQPREMGSEELAANNAKMNYKFAQLTDLSLIAEAEYTGMDTADNVDCYKLILTDKKNIKHTCYIDKTNLYTKRMISKADAGGTGTDIVITFKNFQKQNEGITIPMTVTTNEGKIYFSKLTINTSVSDDILSPVVK
ncbi:MAG: hypothetical protein H7257_04515 [Taibaiella sp.]|nr:hypothetical protein [Taibaiella sp.]